MRIVSTRLTLPLAMLVPCLVMTWLAIGPDPLTPLSYALFAGLLTALAAIAAVTYTNASRILIAPSRERT